MAKRVHRGYTAASTLAHRARTAGTSTSADHDDQAKWRLGMAAYWFEILWTAPESNDQRAP